jgi:hypothetical protein
MKVIIRALVSKYVSPLTSEGSIARMSPTITEYMYATVVLIDIKRSTLANLAYRMDFQAD